MGNAHVTLSSSSKKMADKDEVRNGNGISAAIQDSTAFPPAKTAMASVDDLTDLQKTLLQESWIRLEKDIAQVGIIVFIKVMGAVQRAVHRLQEPEKLHAFLCDLGRKHDKNGAKLEYIDYIGPQFLSAIRPILGQDWTEETEKAWTLLLDYMTATMKESLLEARNGSAAKSLKPQTLPPSLSSSSTAAMDD